jgi:hypothetical protein
MKPYLIILQSNCLETRKCEKVDCAPEVLISEVVKLAGYATCKTISEICECLFDIGWTLVVVDLQTYKIIE